MSTVIATIHGETRAWLRGAWRRYRRVPRPIRWPLTFVALLFLSVIVANLTFGSVQRTETATLLVPAGETVATSAQVDAGILASVEWAVIGADPSAALSGVGPLTARITGPSSELPPSERALAGRFDFKNGFTRNSYQLQLRNDAIGDDVPATDEPLPALRVEVTWTLR